MRPPCSLLRSSKRHIRKRIALKWSARRVRPRGCCAQQLRSPDGYFGTTRPIIRRVVDLIIRVVLYYQPKADNPADNPAVSFVVYLLCASFGPAGLILAASALISAFIFCIFVILSIDGGSLLFCIFLSEFSSSPSLMYSVDFSFAFLCFLFLL